VDSQSTQLGYGHHTLPMTAEDLCPDLDPALLARKGRLFLLATPEVNQQALVWICRDYYSSRSFDAVPTLVHSMTQGFRDHGDLEGSLFLLAVQRGLDMYLVGTVDAIVRLARFNVARDLFDPLAVRAGFRMALTEHAATVHTPALYSTVWRLVRGDVLLMTTRPAAGSIRSEGLLRVARSGGSMQRAARALSRRGRASAPVIIVRFSQIMPVPDVPVPPRPDSEPQLPQAPRHHRAGTSPVLVAGLIAFLAVALMIWRTGANLQVSDIPAYLQAFFFAEPTPTTPAESAEVQEIEEHITYEAPELVSPYAGARITAPQVELVWTMPVERTPDMRFELLVEGPANVPPVRTLTVGEQYTLTEGEPGWYRWTVRLISVTEGESPVALSPRAETVTFHWSAGAQ
jgi:hypothetical protein